jgi:hypothetical protein
MLERARLQQASRSTFGNIEPEQSPIKHPPVAGPGVGSGVGVPTTTSREITGS